MHQLWTDGACKGNPGPMGIGMLLLNEKEVIVRQWSRHLGQGTNNIAELMAILEGAKFCVNQKLDKVTLYTDSQYSIGVLSLNWKAKANVELIKEIKNTLAGIKELTFIHVRGHQNVKYNDYVDRLASTAAASKIEHDSNALK